MRFEIIIVALATVFAGACHKTPAPVIAPPEQPPPIGPKPVEPPAEVVEVATPDTDVEVEPTVTDDEIVGRDAPDSWEPPENFDYKNPPKWARNYTAKALTVPAELTGKAQARGEVWDITFTLGGEPATFSVPKPDKTVPQRWRHAEDDVVFEDTQTLRRQTRAIRVDLGEVDGIGAWLRLSTDGIDLVADTPDGERTTSVTELLPTLPKHDNALDIQTSADWKDGRWIEKNGGEDFGDVDVVIQNGGFKLQTMSGKELLKYTPHHPKGDGCLWGTTSFYTLNERLVAVENTHVAYDECEDSKGDFRVSKARKVWVRNADGTFVVRFEERTVPHAETPVVLPGNQLEWRRTKRSSGRGFFVDWAKGAECGHEGYDFNDTTLWEIRRVGTKKWQPIGEARRLRYRRSFCVNYAGEP